jgi:serine/threonine protein kinase
MWQRLKPLFHAAMELDPEARISFATEACRADSEMKQELLHLIQSEGQGNGPLDRPIMGMDLLSIRSRARFQPGQIILDRFRIVRLLGRGGMGLVYQANHLILGRDVALKTLLPDTVEEPFNRLIQEARVAVSLDHPNIVKVYDVANADGVAYIEMEYFDGQTLREMIDQRPLRPQEVLQYASQIAMALGAAHDVGVLHRDVKPGNIMITRKNVIKVLDFGLARHFDLQEPVQHQDTSTGTFDSGLMPNRRKRIMGTIGYMSPEQIKGLRVDARSDIFSFGVVLYEMLTRVRPFAAPSDSEVLDKILNQDPRPIREIIPEISAELDDLVRFCLHKDPEDRARSMHDVAHSLEQVRRARERITAQAADVKKWRRWLLPAFALILFVVAGLAVDQFLTSRNRKAEPLAALRRMTWEDGLADSPALSNDGKLLAFASDRAGNKNLDLFILNTNGGQPIRLTDNPADDSDPSFSPDGSLITYRSERQGGGVYVMPSLGGQERLIAPRGQNPRFSPDGKWIVYWIGERANIYPSGRTYIVPSTGGVSRQLQPSFADARYPLWTPDGAHILFLGVDSWAAESEPHPDWWVTPTDEANDRTKAVKTGALETIENYGWPAVYPPGGWYQGKVVFSARDDAARLLFTIPISSRTWRVEGPPKSLTFGTGIDGAPNPSPSGTITFTSFKHEINFWFRTVDESGWIRDKEAQKLTNGEAYHTGASMSSDGKRLVYLLGRRPRTSVWIRDIGTGREAAITFDTIDKCSAAISPDGTRVAWSDCGPGPQAIFEAALVSDFTVTDAEKICDDCGRILGWAPNGDAILFVDHSNPVRVGIFSLRSASRTMISISGYNLQRAQFAPAGDWIALTATKARSDRSQIFVVPLKDGKPGPTSAWIAITNGESWDDNPVWTARGDALLFYSGRDGSGCIWRQRVNRSTKRPEGVPVEVLKFHSGRLSIRELTGSLRSLSLMHNELVFNILERTGSVWILDERPAAPSEH